MKWRKQATALVMVLLLAALLTGCMRSAGTPEATPEATGAAMKPNIPSKLSVENGVPQLDVYDTA